MRSLPSLTRRVVSAANRSQIGTIIVGPRHWDSTMHATHHLLYGETPTQDTGEWEQGFINSWGEFLTRKEAWQVAMFNNQVIRLVGSQTLDEPYDTKLYSENLY